MFDTWTEKTLIVNLANAGYAIVCIIAALAVVIALGRDILPRLRRRRSKLEALSHERLLRLVGPTMADGGEPTDEALHGAKRRAPFRVLGAPEGRRPDQTD